MRVAIVGCGLIGHKRAKALGTARLVAAVDTNLARARQLANERFSSEAIGLSLKGVYEGILGARGGQNPKT